MWFRTRQLYSNDSLCRCCTARLLLGGVLSALADAATEQPTDAGSGELETTQAPLQMEDETTEPGTESTDEDSDEEDDQTATVGNVTLQESPTVVPKQPDVENQTSADTELSPITTAGPGKQQEASAAVASALDSVYMSPVHSSSPSQIVFIRRIHYQMKQEAQLMLTTGSTRLAVSRGQQTWYHSTCYI